MPIVQLCDTKQMEKERDRETEIDKERKRIHKSVSSLETRSCGIWSILSFDKLMIFLRKAQENPNPHNKRDIKCIKDSAPSWDLQ